MKKLLRSILSFLDRKFPDQLVVTVKEYEEIKEAVKLVSQRIATTETILAAYKEESGKLVKKAEETEAAIGKLNLALGLSGPFATSNAGKFQR